MEPNRKVNIHSILQKSDTNGPGTRSVVWFQGCALNCKGCFNQDIRELKENRLMCVREVIEQLPVTEIEGVTISGGEPFLQPEGLYHLVKDIKDLGLTVVIYTGYKYKDLIELKCDSVNKVLGLTDILIDGPYREDIEQKHSLAGSGNQKIYYLSDRYKEQKKNQEVGLSEIIITDDGQIIETGFLNILNNEREKSVAGC